MIKLGDQYRWKLLAATLMFPCRKHIGRDLGPGFLFLVNDSPGRDFAPHHDIDGDLTMDWKNYDSKEIRAFHRRLGDTGIVDEVII